MYISKLLLMTGCISEILPVGSLTIHSLDVIQFHSSSSNNNNDAGIFDRSVASRSSERMGMTPLGGHDLLSSNSKEETKLN